MANHDYVLDDNPGATFRADLNSVLKAIVTNNSSATEPAVTFPNMWWYDTSTSLLKRRNNANDAWITLGLEAASTDGAFAANSDSVVPTQKAAKTYVDGKATDVGLTLTDVSTNNASTTKHGFLKKLSNVATEFMNGVGNWVAITIDALLPSQTGNSGKFLTTNGSVSSWASGGGIPMIAGTYPIGTYPGSYSDRPQTTYTKIAEMVCPFTGVVSSYTDIGITDSPSGNTQIWVNGVAVGVERGYSGRQSYNENITVKAGDFIQIYAKAAIFGRTCTIYSWILKGGYYVPNI